MTVAIASLKSPLHFGVINDYCLIKQILRLHLVIFWLSILDSNTHKRLTDEKDIPLAYYSQHAGFMQR